MVKDLVSADVCDLGWSDTDDFYEAHDEGKPVAMLPVRLENGAAICIPNTVAIIRGSPHPAAAQKLVDFLLSEKCEMALASAKSRQIPLGPVETVLSLKARRQLREQYASLDPFTLKEEVDKRVKQILDPKPK